MHKPWRQEDVDKHYTRFTTTLHDEESLEQMIEPVIKRFAAAGLRTAIVTEKPAEAYLIHCIAIRLLKGEIPQLVSEKISEQVSASVLDGIKVTPLRQSSIEPIGISFGKPRF